MAKNIEFSAEEMSELHTFYSMEMEKAELRLKAIKSIIAKIGSAPQKRGPKTSASKQTTSDLNAEILEAKQSSTAVRRPGRPAKIKPLINETKVSKRRGRPSKMKTEVVSVDSSNVEVISAPKKRGPKPGTKYKKQADKRKARVIKTPKLKLSIVKSSTPVSDGSILISQTSPKKRGPKPGAKYKKRSGNKTNNQKSVKQIIAVLDNSKPVAVISKREKTPKAAKKVVAVKASSKVAKTDAAKTLAVAKEVKAPKLPTIKIKKPAAIKIANAKVVKPAKAKVLTKKPIAVKVNNAAKKLPAVKVKASSKVTPKEVAKTAILEPQA